MVTGLSDTAGLLVTAAMCRRSVSVTDRSTRHQVTKDHPATGGSTARTCDADTPDTTDHVFARRFGSSYISHDGTWLRVGRLVVGVTDRLTDPSFEGRDGSEDAQPRPRRNGGMADQRPVYLKPDHSVPAVRAARPLMVVGPRVSRPDTLTLSASCASRSRCSSGTATAPQRRTRSNDNPALPGSPGRHGEQTQPGLRAATASTIEIGVRRPHRGHVVFISTTGANHATGRIITCLYPGSGRDNGHVKRSSTGCAGLVRVHFRRRRPPGCGWFAPPRSPRTFAARGGRRTRCSTCGTAAS